MNGTLYGVGVGPGDPELLTQKAIRTMRECAVIAVPDSGSGEQLALRIAQEYVTDKEILSFSTPMTKDQTITEKSYQDCAETIAKRLEQGEDVAFLTLGDPSIYATYMYVHHRILEMGHRAKMIPGVPSFCAVAAALNTSLCERSEPLHILPASYENTEDALLLDGCKVLMKSGKNAGKLIQTLQEKGLAKNASLVERCGLPEEHVVKGLENYEETPGYFTIIVVR